MVALNSSSKKFIKYLLPTFIWAGFMSLASSIPGDRIPVVLSRQDILFHIFEYAIFGWLVKRTLKNYYPNLKYLSCIFLTLVIGLIYGIIDEFHQASVPYRDASLLDLSLDNIGVVIGSIFYQQKG